jgi:hypothetical protein
MVVTCYKIYGTPPNSTGVPVTRTRYALASEIALLAGHACVLARLLRRGSKNNSGKLALAHGVVRPLDARRGAKSIGLFAVQRKSDQKIAF